MSCVSRYVRWALADDLLRPMTARALVLQAGATQFEAVRAMPDHTDPIG